MLQKASQLMKHAARIAFYAATTPTTLFTILWSPDSLYTPSPFPLPLLPALPPATAAGFYGENDFSFCCSFFLFLLTLFTMTLPFRVRFVFQLRRKSGISGEEEKKEEGMSAGRGAKRTL